jgi:CBS domain-containing protein
VPNTQGIDLCPHCEFPLAGIDAARPADPIHAALMQHTVAAAAGDAFQVAPADESITAALQRMTEGPTRALLVAEHGAIVGIVTAHDAILNLEPGQPAPSLTVRDIMSPRPATVPFDAPLGAAVSGLCLNGYHQLPLTSDDGVRRSIAVRDVLAHLAPILVN